MLPAQDIAVERPEGIALTLNDQSPLTHMRVQGCPPSSSC